MTVQEANKLLARVTDLRVEIHYDEESYSPSTRLVRWADLDYTTDDEPTTATMASGIATTGSAIGQESDMGRWRLRQRVAGSFALRSVKMREPEGTEAETIDGSNVSMLERPRPKIGPAIERRCSHIDTHTRRTSVVQQTSERVDSERCSHACSHDSTCTCVALQFCCQEIEPLPQ